MADKPSKHYVCDALDAMQHFVKTQKRKIVGLRQSLRQKETPLPTNPTPVPTAGAPAQPVAGPSTTAPPPPPLPAVMPLPALASLGVNYGMPVPQFGGMEDVD